MGTQETQAPLGDGGKPQKKKAKHDDSEVEAREVEQEKETRETEGGDNSKTGGLKQPDEEDNKNDRKHKKTKKDKKEKKNTDTQKGNPHDTTLARQKPLALEEVEKSREATKPDQTKKAPATQPEKAPTTVLALKDVTETKSRTSVPEGAEACSSDQVIEVSPEKTRKPKRREKIAQRRIPPLHPVGTSMSNDPSRWQFRTKQRSETTMVAIRAALLKRRSSGLTMRNQVLTRMLRLGSEFDYHYTIY